MSFPEILSDAGGSSSGDVSAETASTRQSERDGADKAKPIIAPLSSSSSSLSPAAAAAAVAVTDDRRSFQTLTRLRDGQCEVSDCRVLITGCGRSGTHFLTEQFEGAGANYPEDLNPFRSNSTDVFLETFYLEFV